MFNSQRPSLNDLPTTRQLLQATAFAFATAAALLLAVILPAEYALDPTGVGRALGYTEMGEIKQQLAAEAAADEQTAAITAVRSIAASSESGEQATASRQDVTELTLAPNEGAEIKAVMADGAMLQYEWTVTGGHVNFDTHADAPGISYHGYDKGRESTGESGTLTAAFEGSHGWFWRNRSGAEVTITLTTEGEYTAIERVV